MTCRSWARATNFTWAPQWAHIAELPGSIGRTTARLEFMVVFTKWFIGTQGRLLNGEHLMRVRCPARVEWPGAPDCGPRPRQPRRRPAPAPGPPPAPPGARRTRRRRRG